MTLNRPEYGSQGSDQPESMSLLNQFYEDVKVIVLTETKRKIRFI